MIKNDISQNNERENEKDKKHFTKTAWFYFRL